jgi:2-dehydropantoate 2-reductase
MSSGSLPLPAERPSPGRPAAAPIRRVCVIGAGSIGGLLAAHLARVCEVWVLTRRPEQAERLNTEGLRISGKSELLASVHAVDATSELPPFDLGIFAMKATDLGQAAQRFEGLASAATMMTIQNGIGAERVVAVHGDWPLVSAVTFMSGNRRSDVHVEYELDTATWLGPWAQTNTSPEVVQAVAALINASGLHAEPMADLLPAQWSKLIFNSAVNGVSSLTELPHVAQFADEQQSTGLGLVVRALIDEGRAVAAAAGIELHDDPWEMNVLAVARGETDRSDYAHLPSMLEDVLARRPTEVDFICGALVREAAEHGIAVPVTAAVYRLIKGKEASWAVARPRLEEVSG